MSARWDHRSFCSCSRVRISRAGTRASVLFLGACESPERPGLGAPAGVLQGRGSLRWDHHTTRKASLCFGSYCGFHKEEHFQYLSTEVLDCGNGRTKVTKIPEA